MDWQEGGREVREAFARAELALVMDWAFGDVLTTMAPEAFRDFVHVFAERVRSVDPTVEILDVPVPRTEVTRALARIRQIVQAVATGQPTPSIAIAPRVSMADTATDQDGRARRTLRMRLGDALIWMTITLIAATPRSLIRLCQVDGCPRGFVAKKAQQYCPEHSRRKA
jgi:hypothetical protein